MSAEPLFQSEDADQAEAATALDRARAAQLAWSGLPLQARGDLLRRCAERLRERDGLAELIADDVGKPIAEARAEVERSARTLEYFAGASLLPVGSLYEDAAGSEIRTFRSPHGAVLLLTPWNFPLAIPTWKLAPALLCGNAAVLKPAGPGARVAAELAGALQEAGLPDDVVRIVRGGAETGRNLLAAGPDAISFTGSTAVGEEIAAHVGSRLTPLQLEMGGKNVAFVAADAELERAARDVALGAVGFAGQKCTATSVVLVEESAERRFGAALRTELERTPPLPARDENAVLGPLINADARDRIAAAAAGAADRGLEVESFGATPASGCFHAATLVSGGGGGDPVYTEELFGPLLALGTVRSSAAAVAAIRGLPYGLVAAIHTKDRATAHGFAREVGTGLVRVNSATTGLEPHVPFGGSGRSGHGPREQGLAALDFYSETRTVYEG